MGEVKPARVGGAPGPSGSLPHVVGLEAIGDGLGLVAVDAIGDKAAEREGVTRMGLLGGKGGCGL